MSSTDEPATSGDATPPGVEFAYEVAHEQLARALERVSRADTKAGILVGVLVASIGAFLVLDLSLPVRILVGVPLMLSACFVAVSLLIRRVADGPDPRAVAEVVDAAPREIQHAFLPVVLEAYERTSRQAARKERFLALGHRADAGGSGHRARLQGHPRMRGSGSLAPVRKRKARTPAPDRPDPYERVRRLPRRPIGPVVPGALIVREFGKPDRTE